MFLGALLAAPTVSAGTLDRESADALSETLRSLQDAPGAGGPALDPRLRALEASPALSRELYELAGRVLTELAERSGGDPQKMSDALERARKDPEGFASSLSPATRERLRALSSRVPSPEGGDASDR